MIQMHSHEEALIFGIAFALLVSVVLLAYLFYNFIESLIIDRVYKARRRKASRAIKKALRKIRIEHAEKYTAELEQLYKYIKEGDKIE